MVYCNITNYFSFLQVDEDVQRHNELLGVVRLAPSEISDIVARRRKDFTKEFFVHLHTVAESYYDNPTEQAGELFLCTTSGVVLIQFTGKCNILVSNISLGLWIECD